VCVVDAAGKIVKEAKVATDPHVLVTFFKGLGFPVTRIGLEAGPLSHWLYAGLTQAGFDVVLLETRHVKAVLSAMVVKTDRKDARGIAQLIRMGWFRAVHAKSASSQEIRALLTARRLLLDKLRDVELSVCGILRGFGLKLGKVTQRALRRASTNSSPITRCCSRLPDRCSWRARRCSGSTIHSTRHFSRSYAATRSVGNL
jgi:transposase